MTTAAQDDDGFVPFKPSDDEDDGFVPAPQGRSALQTLGLNALDSASIVGVPRALAAGEAASEAFANFATGDDTDKEGLVDRYHRKVKENQPIAKGMSEDFSEHPGATIAGQLSTALIPGPKGGLIKGVGALGKLATKFPKVAKLLEFGRRGAVLGGIHGVAAGDADTSGGDIKGTVEDAASGAAFGFGADLVGAGAGKLVEEVGEMAGRKLRSGVLTKAKSIIGKYRQQKGEAGNALDRLEIMDELKKAGAAAPAGLPTTPARKMINKFPGLDTPLRGARVGNAAKDFGQFERNIAKFGPRGVPKIATAKDMALKDMKKDAGGVLRNLLVRSAGAAAGTVVGSTVGEAVAPSLGLEPRTFGIAGGLAGGLGGNYFLMRKTASAILTHPSTLEKVSRVVPGLGRAMKVGGQRMAETVLMTYLRKEENQKKVAQAVEEDGFEPLAGEGDGKAKASPKALDLGPNEERVGRIKPLPNFEDSDEKRRKRTPPTGGYL